MKLYLDVEKEFDAIRDKAQDFLWPENQDEARWSDVADRYSEQAGMYWLPPKGIDTLKSIACNRGLWEDMGNGYRSMVKWDDMPCRQRYRQKTSNMQSH